MEDNRATFTLSIVGKETGKPYDGEFEVKTLLSRRDHFVADARRREILGPSPDGTPPAPKLQAEAYMVGQLDVRITSAPDWWSESNSGLELADDNISSALFELAIAKEDDRKNAMSKKADKAREGLSKKKE